MRAVRKFEKSLVVEYYRKVKLERIAKDRLELLRQYNTKGNKEALVVLAELHWYANDTEIAEFYEDKARRLGL